MRSDLAVCVICDTVHQHAPLGANEAACCATCGEVIYRNPRLPRAAMTPLVVAALITFVIANTTPIVSLEAGGATVSTTLLGSVLALWSEGRLIVGMLVLATAFLFPAFDLLALLTALILAGRTPRPPVFAIAMRTVQAVRPWGMIEVFMLGVTVALIKLAHLAVVTPGAALWAFGAMTVILVPILSFNMESLWAPSDPQPSISD